MKSEKSEARFNELGYFFAPVRTPGKASKQFLKAAGAFFFNSKTTNRQFLHIGSNSKRPIFEFQLGHAFCRPHVTEDQ